MATDTVHPSSGVWVSTAVVALLLLLRLARMGRASGQTRTLRLEALWITPLLYVGLATLVVASQPPQGAEWLWLAAGAGLGGTLGWWRGKTVEIRVNRGTRTLTARTSSAAAVFLLGLMALRLGLRYLVFGEAGTLHLTVKLITGMFLAFALGLVVMQRVEMTLRGARLLSEASASAAMGSEPADMTAPQAGEAAPAAAPALLQAGLSNAQLVMLAVGVFVVIVVAGLAIPR